MPFCKTLKIIFLSLVRGQVLGSDRCHLTGSVSLWSHKLRISGLTHIKNVHLDVSPIGFGHLSRCECSGIQIGACDTSLTLWCERTIRDGKASIYPQPSPPGGPGILLLADFLNRKSGRCKTHVGPWFALQNSKFVCSESYNPTFFKSSTFKGCFKWTVCMYFWRTKLKQMSCMSLL